MRTLAETAFNPGFTAPLSEEDVGVGVLYPTQLRTDLTGQDRCMYNKVLFGWPGPQMNKEAELAHLSRRHLCRGVVYRLKAYFPMLPVFTHGPDRKA